ncbi:MAG: hypothetical protein JWM28_3549 [Chitinophagaceae bacterium]|nr:hypothetical protein [Chitinophagaceae bacterium]
MVKERRENHTAAWLKLNEAKALKIKYSVETTKT